MENLILTPAPENAQKAVSEKINVFDHIYRTSVLPRDIDIETIVVNIPNDDPDWLSTKISGNTQDYRDLLYLHDTENDFYYIDLKRIAFDPDNAKKSNWLEKNNQYINHDATEIYIEDAHRMDHPEILTAIYPKPDITKTTNYVVVTVDDLRDEITDKLNDINSALNFNTKQYDYYIEFKFNSGGFSVVALPYTNTKMLFSVNFLRSVINKHGLSGTDELGIGAITYYTNFNFIWVKDTKHFYDYSNEPR